jgi:diacylglycerol O-acyltransferase
MMLQLSALDTFMLHMQQPHTPLNGGVVLVYDRSGAADGAFGYRDVLDHFRRHLPLVDALRMKLLGVPGSLDRPYWVEDADIDLEYHIRNVTLPPPADWRQFCRQVSLAIERPLDMSRPPWEIEVVDGLGGIDRFPKDSFALILKVHHAALDGKAYLAIMQTLHSLEPDAPAPVPKGDERTAPAPSASDMMIRAALHAARTPVAAVRALGAAGPVIGRAAVPQLARRLLPQRNGHQRATPATRFNGPVSPRRAYGACFFRLTDTEPIRAAVEGATVGDIAVSVLGGALRSYLDGISELPPTAMKAFVLVATPPDDRADLGNHLSGMITSLCSDIDDPLQRLATVRASTRDAKKPSASSGRVRVTGLLEIVPEIMVAPIFRVVTVASTRSSNGLAGMFNTAVTGMAGPAEPLYLGRVKLTHLLGLGPVLDGLGLINIHASYDGAFTIFFVACQDMMPDPQRYEECIYTEFSRLHDAAVANQPKSGN